MSIQKLVNKAKELINSMSADELKIKFLQHGYSQEQTSTVIPDNKERLESLVKQLDEVVK